MQSGKVMEILCQFFFLIWMTPFPRSGKQQSIGQFYQINQPRIEEKLINLHDTKNQSINQTSEKVFDLKDGAMPFQYPVSWKDISISYFPLGKRLYYFTWANGQWSACSCSFKLTNTYHSATCSPVYPPTFFYTFDTQLGLICIQFIHQ